MSNLTFSTKKQVVYQAEYKKLMFDLYDLGGQYKVYHKIKWYHDDIPYRESWELVAAYRTLGEAKDLYDHIRDIPVEWDFDEWLEMMNQFLV